MAPNAEKWTFSKNDKRACNQPVTHLNFKDDGKKRDVKILNPLQNVCKTCITLSWIHSASIFLEKKTRLQKRRVVSALEMRQRSMALGHKNGNESQQENQNCANDGNHNGNVFDDSFNRVLRLV